MLGWGWAETWREDELKKVKNNKFNKSFRSLSQNQINHYFKIHFNSWIFLYNLCSLIYCKENHKTCYNSIVFSDIELNFGVTVVEVDLQPILLRPADL